MKLIKYKEIEDQVPSITKYLKEVDAIVEFFNKKGLVISNTSLVFWNHVITLFERIDEKNQDEIALDDIEEMSVESQDLTKEFESSLNEIRDFDLTEFEIYMLTIHFEQIIKEN